MRRGTLKHRIIIVFSLLLFGLITLLCITLSLYIRSNYTNQDQVNLQSFTSVLSQQVLNTLDEMNKYSVLVYFSDEITDEFSNSLSVSGDDNFLNLMPGAAESLEKNLAKIIGTDITRYIINLYNQNAFCSTKSYPVRWENVRLSMANGVLRSIEDRLGDTTKADVTILHGAYWTNSSSADMDFLCLSRNFFNLITRKKLGVIQVLLPEKFLVELFASLSPDQAACLINDDGKVIFCTVPENVGIRTDAEFFLREEKAASASLIFDGESGTKYFFSQSQINLDLRVGIFQVFHEGEYLKYTWFIVAGGLALYAVCLSLVAGISRYLSEPLDRIVRSLRGISLDSVSMDIEPDKRYGDFEVLEEAYKNMLQKIHESMNVVIAARENEQRAIYMALQSQISPHFLNNTIAGISAYAYDNGVDRIVEICDKLSAMLIYATDYSETISTLAMELSYAQNYLELMKIRYDGRFFFHIAPYDTLQDLPLPRLLIQTVVENCFKHAFKESQTPWFIDISVVVDGEWWLCNITYNGTSVPQDTLQDILKQSEALYQSIANGQEHLKMGGLGLLNSITRLRIMYRNQIRFEVYEEGDHISVTRFGGKIDAVSSINR